MIEIKEVVQLFVVGYFCGHVLSLLPYLVGSLLHFGFAIMGKE